MFSNESLTKLAKLMNSKKADLLGKDVKEIKMCISSGNKKIGKTLNVSLPPIMTCANCKECKHLCYDVKACLQYPDTVIDARMRNYVILMKDRNEYFERIQKKLNKRRTHKYFRWHVAGDIIDIDYFDRMVKIAKNNPQFKFWTYTKNYKVVNEWMSKPGGEKLPDNFSVMFSEWRSVEMINPYGFGEFRVVFKGEEKPNGFYCPGNCDECIKNERGCITNETVYCNEH